MTATIDFVVCDGCKQCVNVCPDDVLYFDEKSNKPYIAYPEDCLDCYMCERHCPLECVTVVPTRFGIKPTYDQSGDKRGRKWN